jgi:cytochrome P450
MLFASLVLSLSCLMLWLAITAIQSSRRTRRMRSLGYDVCAHWPLLGCLVDGLRVNARDGLTAYFRQQAQRFNRRAFFAPLQGQSAMLVVVDPRTCLEVSRRANELVRGFGFEYDRPALGVQREVLFANHGAEWQQQRARANPFFRPGAMRKLFDTIVACSREVEQQALATAAKTQEVHDIKVDTARITMRVICSHLFGHTLDRDAETLLIDFFLNQMPQDYQIRVAGLGWAPFPSRIGFFRRRREVLAAVAEEICKAEPGSFCELLPGEDEAQKLADVMGLLFAGFETTSNAVAWAVYFLSMQPLTTRAILEQLHGVLGGRSIDELTATDIKACPLLMAVFNESLRLRSPAPGHVGDAVADLTLADGKLFIPKGTTVFAFYLCYFRDELYFDNPETFDIYRWTDGRAEQAAAKAGLSLSEFFTPFLVGQHVCLGRQLAELEAQVILARWLHEFSFSYAGSSEPQCVISISMTADKVPMLISHQRQESGN